MNADDRELGMDRPITRRDFVSGVSVAIGGALVASKRGAAHGSVESQAAQALEPTAENYPPMRSGMRGAHPGSFEAAHAARGAQAVPAAEDTRETYDLIVVGGGLSGLAAAYYFRKKAGPSARILVLDNHDDFGGHAKRNEFTYGGRMLMLNGGTLNIEAPRQYSDVAMGLLRGIGIDIDRFERDTAEDRGIYRRMGLRNGVFFPRERFGADRLVVGTPGGQSGGGSWAEFLAKAPLADRAKRDIERLQSDDQPDYMPGLSDEEKKRRLMHMSYQDFLIDVARVHPDAAWFYQARTTGLFLMMTDGVPAYYGWNSGYPGFQGMKLEPTPREVLIGEPGGAHGRENQQRANEGGRSIHFPDGNATIARLLVRSMLPEAVPGATQEDVVTARVDYAKLDRAGSRTRWITPEADNFGFAKWVQDHAAELAKLGPGRHYGEWYGSGIQRRYGLAERRFALFNVARWSAPESRPACCGCVPIVAEGVGEGVVEAALARLRAEGSLAVPGFERPEGVVVWHSASGALYKVLLEGDDAPKGGA